MQTGNRRTKDLMEVVESDPAELPGEQVGYSLWVDNGECLQLWVDEFCKISPKVFSKLLRHSFYFRNPEIIWLCSGLFFWVSNHDFHRVRRSSRHTILAEVGNSKVNDVFKINDKDFSTGFWIWFKLFQMNKLGNGTSSNRCIHHNFNTLARNGISH